MSTGSAAVHPPPAAAAAVVLLVVTTVCGRHMHGCGTNGGVSVAMGHCWAAK